MISVQIIVLLEFSFFFTTSGFDCSSVNGYTYDNSCFYVPSSVYNYSAAVLECKAQAPNGRLALLHTSDRFVSVAQWMATVQVSNHF